MQILMVVFNLAFFYYCIVVNSCHTVFESNVCTLFTVGLAVDWMHDCDNW